MFLDFNTFQSIIKDHFYKVELENIFNIVNFALIEGFKSLQPEILVNEQICRKEDFIVINDFSFPIYNKKIFCVGGGKASMDILKALIPILGHNYQKSILNVLPSQCNPDNMPKNTTFYPAGHPFPNESTFEGTKQQLLLLESLTEDDIVFIIISGGASSLLEYPAESISFEDIIETYKVLVTSGLIIDNINVIRKHLSQIKGGKLALRTKAQIIALYLSDVPNNDLGTIGSGPTIINQSTIEDCLDIIAEANLEEKLPIAVLKYLKDNKDQYHNETVKEIPNNTKIFNFLLGSNKNFISVMNRVFEIENIPSYICSYNFTGESSDLGIFLSKYCSYLYTSRPLILIWGGESFTTIETKTLSKQSSGGRNQELILSFIISALTLKSNMVSNSLLLSLATDGKDGNSVYAGGWFIVNENIYDQFSLKNLLKGLNEHNSSNTIPNKFLVKTGDTNTNIGDILIAVLF